MMNPGHNFIPTVYSIKIKIQTKSNLNQILNKERHKAIHATKSLFIDEFK